MKRLNSVIYNKLLAQAEEAKDQDMKQLASGIMGVLTPMPEDEFTTYSSDQLNEDIYNDLWKVAANIIKYYDLSSVDAEKIHEAIELSGKTVLGTVCASLNVDPDSIGPIEPKLPGEGK
jgi:hypothetical protein